VKISILVTVALFFTAEATAQVIFRNDFVIANQRQHRIRNLGLRYVTINLGRYPNWNQLINGRGGRTMVIDIRALGSRRVNYSYTEIAEKVYTPAVFTGPVTQRVPMHLTIAPPNARFPLATFRGPLHFREQHSQSFPAQQ
jgi:hypothetical protein